MYILTGSHFTVTSRAFLISIGYTSSRRLRCCFLVGVAGSLKSSSLSSANTIAAVRWIAESVRHRLVEISFRMSQRYSCDAVLAVIRALVDDKSPAPVKVRVRAADVLDLDFSQVPPAVDLVLLDAPQPIRYQMMDGMAVIMGAFQWAPDADAPAEMMRRKWSKFVANRARLAALVASGAVDKQQSTPIGRFLGHKTLFDPRILNLVSEFALKGARVGPVPLPWTD
jgi:hypothetical protein